MEPLEEEEEALRDSGRVRRGCLHWDCLRCLHCPSPVPQERWLWGGCIRPNARYNGSPSSNAGVYGVLYSACSAAVELSVWHVAPLALDTRSSSLNSFVPVSLNGTGSGCWREFTVHPDLCAERSAHHSGPTRRTDSIKGRERGWDGSKHATVELLSDTRIAIQCHEY